MSLLAQLLVGLVIAIHLYIVWLEMFAWTTRGPRTFRSLPPHLFEPTKVLAANQGLYNGFLAAGLGWALLIADPAWTRNVASFFLGCVAVAGLYGRPLPVRASCWCKRCPPCWPWPPCGWPDAESCRARVFLRRVFSPTLFQQRRGRYLLRAGRLRAARLAARNDHRARAARHL